MARPIAPTPAQSFQIAHKGKTYTGSYTIASKMITVRYLGRTTTTQLGSSTTAPESLASILLRELVDGRKHVKD